LDLTRNAFAGSSAVGEIVASHIYELAALTLGANSEGRELATSGGVRAARLRALKSAIIADPTISLSVLAERHRVTPRYVQMIFEESGSTFTNFSTERRLQKAFFLLSSRRCEGLKIASIAMQCGFGDLSHFNRTFKRRFGATPSEIRREWKR
jgi:AraC-like DNA-binding protein